MKALRTVNPTHTAGTVSLIAVLCISAIACAGDKPVYVSTSDRVYTGSIYYVQAECASCHGGGWDGIGPESKNMKSAGFNPTAFNGEVPADKTPMDYFKSISDPTAYFADKKGKVAEADFNRFVAKHSFHNMTDRARWSISHFLFSRHAGDPYSKNKKAIADEMKEAETVYKEKRRWEIGYTPIANRSTAPALDEMISNTMGKPDPEPSMPSISEERRNASTDISEGASIYKTNCKSCHGKFAEGSVEGPRMGLLGQGPSLENVRGINRKSMSFIAVPDLALSAGITKIGTFKSAHESDSNMIIPAIQNFSDSEWEILYNYTKRLAGL